MKAYHLFRHFPNIESNIKFLFFELSLIKVPFWKVYIKYFSHSLWNSRRQRYRSKGIFDQIFGTKSERETSIHFALNMSKGT